MFFVVSLVDLYLPLMIDELCITLMLDLAGNMMPMLTVFCPNMGSYKFGFGYLINLECFHEPADIR
jgi:hypothetical protein